VQHHLKGFKIIVTWGTDLRKLVLSPMTAKFTIKFHSQSYPGLSGLLLLAAFLKPTGEPYEQPWTFNGDLANQELAVCGCTAS